MPGPRERPRRRSAMLDRRAVLGVNHRRTHRQRGERLVEAPLLLDAAVVVSLGGMKVRERALRRVRARSTSRSSLDLVPLNAGAAHSRVDREMPRPPGRLPALDRRASPSVGVRSARTRGVEVAGEQRREHDDGSRDARRAAAPRLRRSSRRRIPTDRVARARARRAPRRGRTRPPSPSAAAARWPASRPSVPFRNNAPRSTSTQARLIKLCIDR